MLKKMALITLCICLSLSATQAFACFAHMFGSSQAGLASAQRVFNLQHPRMAKVAIGTEAQMVVYYDRPLFAKNVKVTLAGVGAVELIDKKLELADSARSFRVRFLLQEKRMSSILLTVKGEVEGEPVRESSAIYLLPHTERPVEAVPVTSR